MLKRTRVEVDLDAVRREIDALTDVFGARDQLAVTCRPGLDPIAQLEDGCRWLAEGARERDYAEIGERFRGGAIAALLGVLPFAIGRTRLFRLRPGRCHPLHRDLTHRFHLAIHTHPYAYLVFTDEPDGAPSRAEHWHVPADGRLYLADTRRWHTAMNAGDRDRIHLVVNPADEDEP